MAAKRLMNVVGHVTPSFQSQKGDGCAWDVWSAGDQLGMVNLLTDKVVLIAAREIKMGRAVSLNWPLNFPEKPLWGRIAPEINMKIKNPGTCIKDDEIHINTQSGTQWDGLRHFPLIEHGVLYNKFSRPYFVTENLCLIRAETVCASTPSLTALLASRITRSTPPMPGSAFRIGRRMESVDVACCLTSSRTRRRLPQIRRSRVGDSAYAVSVPELEACAQAQGVKFQRGDILILRVGFTKKYYEASQAEREALQGKPETFTGIEQSEDMKRFLWDNHFAATASDQPALERWPTPQGTPHMHQTLLGFVPFQTWYVTFTQWDITDYGDAHWGILENLSEVCALHILLFLLAIEHVCSSRSFFHSISSISLMSLRQHRRVSSPPNVAVTIYS
ncbi:hypothetical protein DFH07DRAFT_1061520 [Mycena maculata]|uniref:Uncharacterized protein n=1 Tax=Mycena maculata TaxID=230809 RepID=A0AAD7IYU1_9AGAR|nr:hypothetical protein DFH07DRAFT_1061520 [Mycena maculata]